MLPFLDPVSGHFWVELVGGGLALTVGLAGLLSVFTSQRQSTLLIAAGFALAGLVDLAHAAVLAGPFEFLRHREAFLAAGWTASRTLLALALLGAMTRRQGMHSARWSLVGLMGAGVLLLSGLVVGVSARWPLCLVSSEWLVPRPWEILPLFFMATALVVSRHGSREHHGPFAVAPLELSLVLGVLSQAMMSASRAPFDPLFSTAHLLKLASYLAVVLGLAHEAWQRRSEHVTRSSFAEAVGACLVFAWGTFLVVQLGSHKRELATAHGQDRFGRQLRYAVYPLPRFGYEVLGTWDAKSARRTYRVQRDAYTNVRNSAPERADEQAPDVELLLTALDFCLGEMDRATTGILAAVEERNAAAAGSDSSALLGATRQAAAQMIVLDRSFQQALGLLGVWEAHVDARTTQALAGMRHVGLQVYLLAGCTLGLALMAMIQRQRGRLQEKTLHESEERYRLAAEGANDALWDWDVRRRTIAWSGRLREMLGLADGAAPSSFAAWVALVQPDDRRAVVAGLRAHLRGEGPFRVECRLRRADSSYGHFVMSGQVQRDRRGRPVRLAGGLTDVSDRRRTEDRLRMIAAGLEQAASGVYITDGDWRILFANRHFLDLYGYFEAEVLGQRPSRLHARHVAQAELEAIEDAIARRKILHRDVVRHRKDGTPIDVDLTISFLEGRDGRVEHYIVVMSDISERKRAEMRQRESSMALAAANRALSEVIEHAEQASRAKSEFIANMSHEIRTPMTAILGFANFLLEPGQPEEERIECATIIRRNGEHLLQLINDILDLSKIEAGRLTVEVVPCRPLDIVDEVASLMHVSATGKGLDFQVDAAGPLPDAIHCDPKRLKQILLNLVGNAIKFTDTGSVRLLVHPGSGPEEIVFEISDTGVGMSPEQMGRLFQAFSQGDPSTARRFGGSGLGLHISRRLAELMGGTIAVESVLGEGSRFTLRLRSPAGRADGGSPAPDSPPASSPPDVQAAADDTSLRGRRVLVVEDGPDNRLLLERLLARIGAEVTMAEDGRSALAAVDRVQPDLILMDMQLPVVDGYSATRALRSRGCTIPIVALTAHAMEGAREGCLAAGCDDFLTKPIDADDLLARVRRHLGRREPVHSRPAG
jgi:PAS domain S-box-containing protein